MTYLWRALGIGLGLILIVLGYDTTCSYAAVDAEKEKAVYEKRCIGCHGEKGDGKGLAAVFLYPKPLDFTGGKFKLRSTPSGEMPTDEDLLKTVTNGISGSAMPSFAFLPEEERKSVIQYIKTVAVYYDEEEDKTYNFFELRGTPHPITVSSEPQAIPESLIKGKAFYEQEKLGCVKCHGRLGKGDGPSAAEQKDDWGRPIKVRDFTTGVFKGGNANKDLYLRFTTGMSGTPMPAFSGEQLTDEERWLLVHYVQSLKNPDIRLATPPEDSNILASQTSEDVPADDPYAKVWDSAKEFTIPLNKLWQPEITPQHMRVRVLNNNKDFAILLEWDDQREDLGNQQSQTFRDAAAIQFSPSGEFPFIGMGNGKNMTKIEIPVNIWQWKGDWQQDLGHYVNINDVYPNMHVDTYYFPKEVQDKTFLSGRAAGNLFSSDTRKSPTEDLNAVGFGSLASQQGEAQNVQGKGIWAEGKWRVVFKRSLSSTDANDVKFTAGATIPIAFAVWDGAAGDRNGQKAVSTWFRLKL